MTRPRSRRGPATLLLALAATLLLAAPGGAGGLAPGAADELTGSSGDPGRKLDILSWFDLEARKVTGAPSTFDAAHLYFIFNGDPRPDIQSYVELEFENGLVADSTLFNGKMLIEQSWFRWDVKPLALKFGKFLLPSGIWVKNHWVPLTPTVSSPLLYLNEVFPEKGVGVLAERKVARGGTLRTESYYLCNGRGPREFYADGDGDKAVGADVAFHLPRGRETGLSVYAGRNGLTNAEERIASLYGRIDGKRWQWTVEGVADAGDIRKAAWYVQPHYKLSERTHLTLRAESYRPDRRLPDNEQRKLTFAHARSFNENLLLKTELSRQINDDPAVRDATGLLSSISVIF